MQDEISLYLQNLVAFLHVDDEAVIVDDVDPFNVPAEAACFDYSGIIYANCA